MERGLIDADLGGGLLKKRIARPGAGKRGGYRVLVARRSGGRWFFIDGFAKNAMENIDADALAACKATARPLLEMSFLALVHSTKQGRLKEVICDAETEE